MTRKHSAACSERQSLDMVFLRIVFTRVIDFPAWSGFVTKCEASQSCGVGWHDLTVPSEQATNGLPPKHEECDEADSPGYFASVSSRQVLPTTRVEYALRGDELLTEGDVRELMQAYITLRTRRLRDGGNNGAPGLSRGT